jgi:hypothetical protein
MENREALKAKIYEAYAEALMLVDFEKVLRVMEVLDWRYANAEHGGVPSKLELAECLFDLFKSAVDSFMKHGDIETSTGGWRVKIVEGSGGEVGVSIYFEVIDAYGGNAFD